MWSTWLCQVRKLKRFRCLFGWELIGIENGNSLAVVIYGEILKGFFISVCFFPHFKG